MSSMHIITMVFLAVLTGLEPVIFRVTGGRVNHYTKGPWLALKDSNLKPRYQKPV